MELIFEVVNRAGRILERHKLSGKRISIGRAYDNDLILAEDTVSPHHAVLEEDEEYNRIHLKDLGSLNGIKGIHSEGHREIIELRSGEEYIFGKVRIRIYTPNHPVADAVSVGGIDRLIGGFTWTSTLVIMAVLLTANYLLELWLTTYGEFKWERVAGTILALAGVAVVAAMFWGLIGRIAKHEMRFKAQLTVVLIYLLIQSLLFDIYGAVTFNTLNEIFSLSFFTVVSFVLIYLLFWFNLYIATNQSGSQRWKTAATIALIFVAISLYPRFISKPDFSSNPEYVKILGPPAIRLSRGVDEGEYIDSATEVFDRIEFEDDGQTIAEE